MTLATRLVLAVALALVAVAIISLLVADRILVREAVEPLERQVEARLAWLRSCIEPGKGEIEWREGDDDAQLAPLWSLRLASGTVLRHVGSISDEVIKREQRVIVGDPDGPATGELRCRDDEYRLVDNARHLELVLTAAIDATAVHANLARQRWLLWTLGPATAGGFLVLLTALIRWQIRPLERMVGRVSAIDADDTARRLGVVGGASECRRLAAAVDALLARIAEARERERTFSAAAAHELRTPLTQLGLALEIAARRERSPEETRRLLIDLHADVERLQHLALGLLQLTSVAEIPVSTVPLAGVLAQYGNAVVRMPEATLTVQADPVLLAVVLGNLVGNARRYAPGSAPEISVTHASNAVMIHVADLGPGVAAADRERVFAPLVRLDAARTIGTEMEGFGLGLAIARVLARRMGGELTCNPRPDGASGAYFVLRLRHRAPA
jgi:two-component system, OmpR family, sensor kinase